MPRSFGRTLSAIWDDADYRSLSRDARFVYIFLFSQTDLNQAGILPVSKPRWEDDLAVTPDELNTFLAELVSARYIVIDERRCELLVRSFIRRDDVWKQPNVFKAAAACVKAAKSAAVKAVLLSEIRRLDLSSVSKETQLLRDDLVTHLEPFGNPSPTPRRDSPDTSGGVIPGEGNRVNSDIPDGDGNSAGQDPSGTLPQPSGNSSANPLGGGKGKGNGPVLEVSPTPKTSPPSPPPPRPRARASDPPPDQVPLLPVLPVPDLKRGGEGESQEQEQSPLDALIAEIRQVRSEWSTPAIRKTLTRPDVAERPWPVIRAAALIVARDRASQQIGRLAQDGPWWAQAASLTVPAAVSSSRPDWCEECDETTRLVTDADGLNPHPCPQCSGRAPVSGRKPPAAKPAPDGPSEATRQALDQVRANLGRPAQVRAS